MGKQKNEKSRESNYFKDTVPPQPVETPKPIQTPQPTPLPTPLPNSDI